MSTHLALIYLPSSVKVPPHPIPSYPIRGVKQRGIIAAPGDVLVPNWFPGQPLRTFYDCISSPIFPFFLRISEKLETLFSLSLSKFGIVLVELITLATLSKLLSFSSTRLSVRLIYNFSQIVERIWRKKLYNCVWISGHATTQKPDGCFWIHQCWWNHYCHFICLCDVIVLRLEPGQARRWCCNKSLLHWTSDCPQCFGLELVFCSRGEERLWFRKNSASIVCSSWFETAESLKGTKS